jgi:hypothetical protein
MKVLAEKRMELSQAIVSLIGSIKDGEGMPALRILPEHGE